MLDLLDRPIAYHRCFVALTGSVTAAVMLSQAVYWSKRTSNADGWFYKTQAQWEEETGLTRSEQETARKKLLSCGFWEEQRKGLPAQLFFRLNEETLQAQLLNLPQSSMRDSCKLAINNPANKPSTIPQTIIGTETTTENTAEREGEPEKPLVSFVEEKPTSQPFSPNDDFAELSPQPQWSIAERFVLKACNLWDELADQEKPIVETNWHTKQAVQVAGKYVMPRLSVEKKVGGTPKLFQEFWHGKLKREVSPRPDYLVEQWEAYDRWLIENHETHRRSIA